MYSFISRLITIGTNVRDLFGLFQPVKESRKKGIKILIFNWRDTKHSWSGGAEIYIQELAKRWVKGGNSVTLFCGNDQLSLRNEVIDGVNIIRRGGFYTVYLWAALYYIFKFRHSYDVIIDSENGIPFFTPLFTSKPVVLLIHHVHQEIFIEQMRFPLSYIGKFIEGKLMPIIYRNKQVIAVSESSKNEIVKVGIAKSERIQIVNPGIEIPTKNYKKTSYPTAIYLGRLKAYKNIDVAIRAFAKVSKRITNAKFWIVGEGDVSEELKNLVKKLNLEKKVLFFGKVSGDKKVQLLSRGWVALQPSKVEGWGITVLEANSCRTPVIASDTKGLRDSIVDGKTGMLVKVRDTEAFSHAMENLLTKNSKRAAFSEDAYIWAKKFNWDKSAESFYQTVLAESMGHRKLFSFQKATYIANRLSTFLV